jgi:eukaryotic-like serine/threonine-protein kinase
MAGFASVLRYYSQVPMSAESETTPGTTEREIFILALQKTIAAERAAFLDAACGHDRDLRRRIEELLDEQAVIGNFLETPALADPRGSSATISKAGPGGTALLASVAEKPGDRIGRYKLLQKIGEGGCGVVYMAEQEESVRRRVALKVIKLGMDTKSVVARFEAERQALALMEHPNIAKVFDAGATATGRPFFVMELVRGIRITDYCDQHNLSTRERLDLFLQVCQAIQHAHQKGIIHRDIKPSNILVTLHDGTPVPKVIDFGIAKATEQKLTDKTLFTEFTAFLGTPAYMSPEQAEMSGLDIDTRSDIYALGVLLYELLTGKTPFDAEALLRGGLDGCRRTIREQEPARPSTRLATMFEAELTTAAKQRRTEAVKLIHLLRGDLDWVVMKCLEKDRTRRYETASGLALDVRRYLENEPVLARPPSNVYRLRKLFRRHRGAFAATAGIAFALIAGVAISSWQAIRATRAEHRAQIALFKESQARKEAEQEKASARLNEYVADINLAQQSLAAGNYGRAVKLLEKHHPRPGEPDLRGFEWRYLLELCRGDDHLALPNQDAAVQALAFSPDGSLLAIGLRENLNVWDLRSKTMLVSIPKGVLSMAFSPDGRTLVTASPASVRIWRVENWSEQKVLPASSGPVAFSKDGSLLATETERVRASPARGVRIWDTSNWSEIRILPNASGPMAFAPDSKVLATDTSEGITLWQVDTGISQLQLHDSNDLFFRGPGARNDRVLAFSPDGQSIVAARNTLSEKGVFVVSIWDARSGEHLTTMPEDPEHVEHTGVISGLAISTDGRTIATASWDYSIRLWDLPKRQRLVTLHGHLNEVWTMALSADGQTIATGGKDGGVKLWSANHQKSEDILPGHWEPVAFSADARTMVARSRQGLVAFINLATREPDKQFFLQTQRSKFPPQISLSADLKTMVHSLDDGVVRFWNTDTAETNHLKVSDTKVDLVSISPDGRMLITGGRGQPLRWRDMRSGESGQVAPEGTRVLFSPNGRTLAVFARGSEVQLWDTSTRTNTISITIAPETLFGPGFAPAAFSPDGAILASASGVEDVDNAIHLWDTSSGKLIGVCAGHKQAVWSLAFCPSGRTLATASDDSTLKLWNIATQQELLSLRRLGGALRGLLFSPDGHLLVGSSGPYWRQDGIRFYRAPLLAPAETAPTR